MAVPEMGKYLRLVVDNPLEEGQFENAISLLDNLRSPNHTPSTIHILHLIFIALHPADHSSRLDQPSALDPYLDSTALLQQSPRKIIKQTKSALLLPPAAVRASQSLLHAFLRTNGSAAPAPALPTYPETKNAPLVEFEFIDSPIYKQATALKNARSVWEIIKSGYVNKSMQTFATPKSRGKQPRSSAIAREPSFTVTVNDWESQAEIKPVADDAWPVLDWIVALFEDDAELTEKSGQPKHSPLLLKQLPPPPIGSTTRWDASEPLKVVLYALQQTDEGHQSIGLRLFHLLIDLTQTPHLNLPSFTSTVLSQLAASSSSSSSSQLPSPVPSAPTTPPPHNTADFASSSPPRHLTHQEALTSLFAHLSPTPTPSCLTFRMALCKKILAELESDAVAQDSQHVASKPLSGFGSHAAAASSANGVGGASMNEPRSAGGGGGAEQSHARVPRPRPRPVPRPRPLTRNGVQAQVGSGDATTATPTSPTKNGNAPSSASATPLASATSTSSASSTAPQPPTSTPPLTKPKAQLPPLPSLQEIARLLSLRPPAPLSTSSSSSAPLQTPMDIDPIPPKQPHTQRSTRGRMATRRSATPAPVPAPAPKPKPKPSNFSLSPSPSPSPGPPLSLSPSNPWTSPPSLLLRVRFELVSAWIAMRLVRRELARELDADQGGGGKGKDGMDLDLDMDLEGTRDSEELEGVIEDAFGKALSREGEEEEENVRADRLFYRDALRAFAGLPIQIHL